MPLRWSNWSNSDSNLDSGPCSGAHYETPWPKRYGVFQHLDYDGNVTGRGYVVRSRYVGDTYAYPYNVSIPRKEYARPHAAQQYCDKLNGDRS
jgi:hypothetical protein